MLREKSSPIGRIHFGTRSDEKNRKVCLITVLDNVAEVQTTLFECLNVFGTQILKAFLFGNESPQSLGR
jgi:hypothetical protein